MPASTSPKLEKDRIASHGVMQTKYIMAFTAGALLYRESLRIAEMYSSIGDWSAVRDKTLDTNLLQTRTKSTAKRILREVISRLSGLTAEQLAIVTDGNAEEQKCVLWLAICKRYRFIWDFAVEILRERYLTLSGGLTRSDYASFFSAKAVWHPELEVLSPSTQERLRQTLFKMMREAGLIAQDGTIVPAFLSPRVAHAILSDRVDAIAIYPATEADIRKWATR